MLVPDGTSLASIDIGISPNIFHSAGFALTWHSLIMALATIYAVFLAIRWGREGGIPEDGMSQLALWGVIGGLIGARLIAVVDNWGFYSNDPVAILRIWEGGIAVWGAFMGGVVVGIVYACVNRYPIRYLLDVAAPAMIIGQAIGRIGDVINGEHFSTTTDLPWAVVYTHSLSPGFGLPASHPAVAYEMFADFALFGILMALRGRVRPHGALFGLTALSYGAIRLGLAPLRLDSSSNIGGFDQQAFIGLLVMIGAALWIAYLRPFVGPRSIEAPPFGRRSEASHPVP